MWNDIKQLCVSSRPISWVNTAYPFVAGYLVATHTLNVLVVIGGLYFLIPYNLMMYGINDVFDYESDIKNPRKGGIEGALLSKRLHRITVWSSIVLSAPFLAYLFLHGTVASNLILVYLVFMVLAYSVPVLRFKERPFIDSFTSATHFAGPLLYALVLAGWQPSYVPYVAAFFAWGMASHAFGAVQDIIADRKAGIGSIATVLGAKRTVLIAFWLYIASGALILYTGTVAALACAALALAYAINVGRFMGLSDNQAETAHKGWQTFLWLNWVAGAVITIAIVLYFRG